MKLKGFSTVEIIVVIIIILLLIGGNVFLSLYLQKKNQDLSVLSDLSRIKSGLDLYYSLNRTYPLKAQVVELNDEYEGTEIICANGFGRKKDGCDKFLAIVPNTYFQQGNRYSYQTNENASSYQIQFNLLTNISYLRLIKGPNCLVDGVIQSGKCVFNQ